jgi:hypothetical protein
VQIHNGKTYVTDEVRGTLHELVTTPVSTSLLDGLRSEAVLAAGNYLRHYRDNSTDNTIVAHQMIGLALARQVVTDSALLTQIDAAMAYLDGLLRSRQRVDGGWGRYLGQESDTLVTAMVGMALDHLAPSPRDPAIRRTIQYLLNTQTADGSWANTNNGLTTNMAATSFVLAYLPKALDRLGGIDVDLHLDLPANIRLANPTIAPTATLPSANGGAEHIWQVLGVTLTGRDIEFDLTLDAMQLHETRPAARAAYLEFANSFTREPMRLDLAIPNVTTAEQLALAVATDKSAYLPNEAATVTAVVNNIGPGIGSGTVVLSIRGVGTGINLVDLPVQPFTNLTVGAQIALNVPWNTATTLAGNFEVYGRLYDAQGRLQAESRTPFAIVAPGTRATTAVTTDKPQYNAWDTIAINGRVQNVAPNAILPPSRVELTVRTPAGAVLYFDTTRLGEMAPGALRDLPFSLRLADVEGGTYTVELVLKDDFTRTQLSSAATSFQVVRQAAQGVVGSVLVNLSSVYLGDPNVCNETTRNVSATALTGVRLIHQLVNMDTGVVVDEVSEVVNLAAGGQPSSYFRTVNTRAYGLGGFACVLKAEVNGEVRNLAFGGFRVLEPPIRVDAALRAGAKGRLLVLLDDPRRCATLEEGAKPDYLPSSTSGSAKPCITDRDPYGPKDAPSLSAQRSFLEGVLRSAGWSYTITETADAFTHELRSGNYSAYALLAEHEKLDEQVQKELREAVFRGEGLIVAGTHDARHYKLHDALGLKLIGRVTAAVGAELTPSALNTTGSISLIPGDKALRIKRLSAQSVARYVLGTPSVNPREDDMDGPDCRESATAPSVARDPRLDPIGDDSRHYQGSDKSSDDRDECDGHPESYLDAATLNNYGEGRAAFVGFDLLANAAREDRNGPSTATFLAMLSWAAEPMLPTLSGTVLPLELVLTNRGVPTPVTADITLPAGVVVLDAGGGQVINNVLRFSQNLYVGDEKILRFWVKLPFTPGPITFNATVTTGTPSVTRATATYSVQVATPELAPLMDQTRALIAAGNPERNALNRALDNLEKANANFYPEKAIEYLLKASDALLGSTDPAILELRAGVGLWVRYASALIQ